MAVACALRVQAQGIVVRWTSVLCSTAWGDVCECRQWRIQRAKRSGSGQNLVSECEQQILGTATDVPFLFRPRKSPKNTTRERRCRKPIAPWNGSLLPSSVFKPPSLLTLSRHADADRSSAVIGFVMRNSCRLCKKKIYQTL